MDPHIGAACPCASYKNCTKFQCISHWFAGLKESEQRRFRAFLSQDPIPEGEAILKFGVSVKDFCVACTLTSPIPQHVQKCSQQSRSFADFGALIHLMMTSKT